MGTINWLAVIVAMSVGSSLTKGGAVLTRRWVLTQMALMSISAIMLGHAFARIGVEKLTLKPQLYFMQSGGFALAFVIPALWISQSKHGISTRVIAKESGLFLCAYLAMGAVFWVMG